MHRYLCYVAALSREQFDSIEYDAAASGDHATAAREMTELATTGTGTTGMPRAEAFLRAGEQWLLADQPAEAVAGFRRALAEGGPVFIDPRVPLARALFQLGQQAEAQALITGLKAEGPTDPRTCDLVAELLVERSELAAALDWATAGVELSIAAREQGTVRDGDESELKLLLRLRYRIRVDLGLPEDNYDAMLDEA
jgi:Tetratricopeptide repeat